LSPLANVGWQRSVTVLSEQFRWRPNLEWSKEPPSLGRFPSIFQPQSARLDHDDLSGNQPAARLTEKFPQTGYALTQEKPFPLPAGALAHAEQSRRQHARIVEQQQIPSLQ